MKYVVESSTIIGEVLIPASKSHTIRSLFVAALADGESTITNPLDSDDARSALTAVTAMGAKAEARKSAWRVWGHGGDVKAPADPADVGNSGSTPRFAPFASVPRRNVGVAPTSVQECP